MAPPEAMAGHSAGETTPEQINAMIAAYQGSGHRDDPERDGQLGVGCAVHGHLFLIPVTGGSDDDRHGTVQGRLPRRARPRLGLSACSSPWAAGSLWLINVETSALVAAGFPLVETMMRPANTFLAPLVSLAYASALILLARFGLKLILTAAGDGRADGLHQLSDPDPDHDHASSTAGAAWDISARWAGPRCGCSSSASGWCS